MTQPATTSKPELQNQIATNPNSVPNNQGVRETKREREESSTGKNFVVPAKKRGAGRPLKTEPVPEYKPPVADLKLRTRFTKAMAERAREDGMYPLEFLSSIAMDPTLTFTDWTTCKGELVQVERTATLDERIDCAKTVLPYLHTKKIDIQHSGSVHVIHALAESALDATELDDQGNVIDADFSEFDM